MVEFFVDFTGQGTPFPHYWELSVGSCHAVTGLRSDWREQLAKAHRELGFQYVRFHGLLDDDMSVCGRQSDPFRGESKLRYAFVNIDSIFDFLLEIGMKPFIELGFMPSALASGTQTCFHYKANVTPPADYGEWEALIRALVQHLVDRYSLEEVRTWFFEVWNEPNLSFFWAGSQAEYFKLYEHAARAVKSVDGKLRVGGPATSINAWLSDMLAFCRASGAPIDFLSTHHYPTDDPLWRNSDLTIEDFFRQFRDEMGKYKRGVLREMTERARVEAATMLLYYTEWNSSAILPDPNHDISFSAALVAKTIADNDGLVDGYSFWTFSDIFEEQGQFAAPFHGGFGLQTIHGIPKPTYRVFEMLHNLGDRRQIVEGGAGSTVEVLAVCGETGPRLLAYNHNVPGGDISAEEVVITLEGILPGTPASITRVDAENANPRQKWVELSSPEYPTRVELAEIERASRPPAGDLHLEFSGDKCVVRFILPPHGVALIALGASAD